MSESVCVGGEVDMFDRVTRAVQAKKIQQDTQQAGGNEVVKAERGGCCCLTSIRGVREGGKG